MAGAPSLGNYYYMMPLIEINDAKIATPSSNNYHILFQYKVNNIQFYVIQITDVNYQGVGIVEVLEITGAPPAKIKMNVLQGSSTTAQEFDVKGTATIEI